MHTLLSLFVVASTVPSAELRLVRVAEYDGGLGKATEIVSVQPTTARAALLNADLATIDVVDLSDPAAPRRAARHELRLAPGESSTSVAFHPSEDYFVVAVQGAGVNAAGRLEMRGAKTGELLAAAPCGVGPDSVTIDPAGRFVAAACEGEGYEFERATKTFRSPPGSVTWVDLSRGPTQASAKTLILPAANGVVGALGSSDARRIERTIDWNGNGKLDAEVDFDGDGKIGAKNVVVGTYEGRDVTGDEKEGETFDLPLPGAPASAVEPECLVFSADASRLYVTLQEVNAFAVIDVAKGELVGLRGAGVTEHAADVKKDERADFGGTLVALREPDGIALSADGRFLITADEGDTDPKLPKVVAPGRAGGGRTLSVFDAATGKFVGDTGAELDRAVAAAGLYPDDRSEAKGAEPEMVVGFGHGGRSLAAVGLERGGCVALVDLADPAKPRVLGVAACGADAEKSRGAQPEGLAVLRRGETLYVLAANEGSGTLTVFALRDGAH
jgi:DNA-binding beta-propeller fold protein YncE